MAEAGSRGCLASAAGAGIGGLLLGGGVWLLVRDVVADSENGFFHDPDAGLILFVPLLAWIGAVVGAPLMLRLRGHRVGATAVAVAFAFPFAAAVTLGTMNAVMVALSPALAGLAGRGVVTISRRDRAALRPPPQLLASPSPSPGSRARPS